MTNITIVLTILFIGIIMLSVLDVLSTKRDLKIPNVTEGNPIATADAARYASASDQTVAAENAAAAAGAQANHSLLTGRLTPRRCATLPSRLTRFRSNGPLLLLSLQGSK